MDYRDIEKEIVDGKMKCVMAKYRVAQEIPINIMLTTGKHYYAMLDSSMTWREIKQIYYRGYIGDDELVDFKKILSHDSYKNLSKFRLKNGKSILIRNSQIIGMIFDENVIMANINDFASELEKIANEYNLSDEEIDKYEIDNYLGW
ncbi:hypothetical protein [Lactobacillus helveticus]|uniref:hypothetical protein n=1 Tax=Lactobacillus helveticus TaxID=1587 RepID=UPI00062AC3A7|nr:hypothetical protein [Lactobacillus helveticus]AKG66634.1 hypothetical protein TU99_04750 [Lactobacillus helveticus]